MGVLRVLGSCNGLVYLSQQAGLGVANLGVIHHLRKRDITSCHHYHYHYSCNISLHDGQSGLGFDGSTDTFKLVCVLFEHGVNLFITMVHVIGKNSWRRIPQVPSYPITDDGAIFAHGCLHCLVMISFSIRFLIFSFYVFCNDWLVYLCFRLWHQIC